MKTQLAIALMALLLPAAQAQNRANVWELGINPQGDYSVLIRVDFSNGVADTSTDNRYLGMFNTNASICDTTGQLLFYTNGVWIANRNHDSLQNCQDFNPGFFTDFYGDEGLGFVQAVIILPKPGSGTNYWTFSISSENFFPVQPFHLSASEVDMNLDGGLGGMVAGKKNLHVIEDTLSQGRITACKHANGRDWWVVIHKYYSDLYYKVLITPDTMEVFTQKIGNKFTSNDINGMAVFSPDGSQYAHLNINDTIDLLQFDRCTGEFYNHLTLAVPDSPVTLSATLGCQFSPNSRFLYVNSYRRLWQFDTWASDVQASRMLIDTIDPLTIYPLFLQQAAPDNKIYISTFNSNGQMPVLHVIHNPDSLGTGCNVEFHGLPLPPTTTNSGIPNFPNYDLGPLTGSPCDTLYSVVSGETNQASTYRLQPNPVHDWLNIIYQSDRDALFTLYNVNGLPVATVSLYHYFKNRLLNVSHLPQGVYLGVVTQQGETIRSDKVIVH